MYLYIHINVHNTHISCKHKLLFLMQRITFNRFDSSKNVSAHRYKKWSWSQLFSYRLPYFFFDLFQSIIENINTTAKLQFQLYFPSHEPFLPKIWIINQWIVFYIISRKYMKTANVILHVSLSMFMFCTCNIVKVLCSFKDILPFTHPYIIPYLFYEWWPQMFLSPVTFIVCERAAWTFC